jgi:acyl carrier protein
MVPARFARLESLPLTSSGKVDRARLPDTDDGEAAGAPYVAPADGVEEILASTIFAGVLGVAQVGSADSFFDLGGDSLQATQIVSRVRDEFDVELPLQALFQAPTVAELARAVQVRRQDGGGADGAAAPIDESILAAVEAMSDEEVERLLAEHRAASGQPRLPEE